MLKEAPLRRVCQRFAGAALGGGRVPLPRPRRGFAGSVVGSAWRQGQRHTALARRAVEQPPQVRVCSLLEIGFQPIWKVGYMCIRFAQSRVLLICREASSSPTEDSAFVLLEGASHEGCVDHPEFEPVLRGWLAKLGRRFN